MRRQVPVSSSIPIYRWMEFNIMACIDFRYGDYGGLMESGTHAMEVITAVIDGPLCFLVAFAAAHDLSWRHPLQLILCTMQLYGLVWFTLQPIWSDTGMAGHFSSDPVRQERLMW